MRSGLVLSVALLLAGACSAPLPTPVPRPSASSSPTASSPTPTHEPTAGPTRSPTPVPPEAIVVDGTRWLRFEGASLPNDLHRFGQIWTSLRRFLAYSGSNYHLLQSPDGESWSSIGPAPGFILYEDERGFLAGGDGLWSSSDGVDWEPLGGKLGFRGAGCPGRGWGGISMYGAYAAETGVVAVGDLRCDTRVVRIAWISTDYEEWQPFATTPVLDVVQANGIYVGIDAQARIRKSRDGLSWGRPIETLLNVQVFAVGSGFVALEGWSPGADPEVLLTSADGQSWTEQPSPFGGSVRDLAASDGTRAIVFENGPFEIGPGAVWISSTDGATWVRHQLPTRQGDRARSVAILGNRVVVIGRLNDASSVTWVADIP